MFIPGTGALGVPSPTAKAAAKKAPPVEVAPPPAVTVVAPVEAVVAPVEAPVEESKEPEAAPAEPTPVLATEPEVGTEGVGFGVLCGCAN